MVPSLTPSCGNDGRGWIDLRPALPPLDNSCSTASTERGAAMAEAKCWRMLTFLLPREQWAGPPWFLSVDQRCSIEHANGLCRSMSSGCHVAPDVLRWCVAVCSPLSFATSTPPQFDRLILSGSSQHATCDGLHASSREARLERALFARLLLRLSVAGPVHGVKTHVPCSQNARDLC